MFNASLCTSNNNHHNIIRVMSSSAPSDSTFVIPTWFYNGVLLHNTLPDPGCTD